MVLISAAATTDDNSLLSRYLSNSHIQIYDPSIKFIVTLYHIPHHLITSYSTLLYSTLSNLTLFQSSPLYSTLLYSTLPNYTTSIFASTDPILSPPPPHTHTHHTHTHTHTPVDL